MPVHNSQVFLDGVVKILKQGESAGSGFIARTETEPVLITCAHVVNSAFGRGDSALDFPNQTVYYELAHQENYPNKKERLYQ